MGRAMLALEYGRLSPSNDTYRPQLHDRPPDHAVGIQIPFCEPYHTHEYCKQTGWKRRHPAASAISTRSY